MSEEEDDDKLALEQEEIDDLRDIAEEDDKILIKKDIKDREIQMYKKYRSMRYENQSIDSRRSVRMNAMLKKIDRKIDERLMASIK